MQYVCVHGHFYQPPRENPSLEVIEPELDIGVIQSSLREALANNIDLDVATLEFVIRKRLEKESEQFVNHLNTMENGSKFRQFVDLVLSLPFPVVLWNAQNILYGPIRQTLQKVDAFQNGDAPAKQVFRDEVRQLGERLKIASP